jgi:hypothetical protein
MQSVQAGLISFGLANGIDSLTVSSIRKSPESRSRLRISPPIWRPLALVIHSGILCASNINNTLLFCSQSERYIILRIYTYILKARCRVKLKARLRQQRRYTKWWLTKWPCPWELSHVISFWNSKTYKQPRLPTRLVHGCEETEEEL